MEEEEEEEEEGQRREGGVGAVEALLTANDERRQGTCDAGGRPAAPEVPAAKEFRSKGRSAPDAHAMQPIPMPCARPRCHKAGLITTRHGQ